MVGKKLFHYKILEELGHGFMRIACKAEDPKLDRTVEIMALHSAVVSSGRVFPMARVMRR